MSIDAHHFIYLFWNLLGFFRLCLSLVTFKPDYWEKNIIDVS